MRASLLLSLALMTASIFVSAAETKPNTQTPSLVKVTPAEIWYTEQFVIHSKIVGRDYLIQVGKPALAKGVKAPALYLLDSNSSFGIVADLMTDASRLPPGLQPATDSAFVVGVGYPSQDIAYWGATRLVDLSPVKLVTPGQPDIAGEGAKFQRFLTQELRPLIEARYSVDPKRAILAGQSIGGLFAAHVLLNDPKAFDGYIIGSPSIAAEPELLDKAEAFVAPAHVPVFIAVGGKETDPFGDQVSPERAQQSMRSDAEALAARLRDHPSNLDVTLYVIQDESHFSMRPAFYVRAMQVIFPPRLPEIAEVPSVKNH